MNTGWTLFLDRDGVINERIIDDYVTTWEDFHFLPGVLESLKVFSQVFGRIVVVTNQQGIGKGLFSEATFWKLSERMCQEVSGSGGRIDRVYLCPHLSSDHCNCRKPNIGNALQAKKDFPEIDFARSIMVGDSKSDIQFGRTAGMLTVSLGISEEIDQDYRVESLQEVITLLQIGDSRGSSHR